MVQGLIDQSAIAGLRHTAKHSIFGIFRMTGAAFAFSGLAQIAHDSTLAGCLIGPASAAQSLQLLLKQMQRLNLLMDAFELAVNEMVDFIACQVWIALKTAQHAHIGQTHA